MTVTRQQCLCNRGWFGDTKVMRERERSNELSEWVVLRCGEKEESERERIIWRSAEF